jgi:hypothetical protein
MDFMATSGGIVAETGRTLEKVDTKGKALLPVAARCCNSPAGVALLRQAKASSPAREERARQPIE